MSCLLRMGNKDFETYGNRLEDKEDMKAVVLTELFKQYWFLFVSVVALQVS